MVASDLYALKGLRLKNEAKLWVIIRLWTSIHLLYFYPMNKIFIISSSIISIITILSLDH